MTARLCLSAVALALLASGCVHTVAAPAERPHPRISRPATARAEIGTAQDWFPHGEVGPWSADPAVILAERLRARGVDVEPPSPGATDGLVVSVWLLGHRPTALTRLTAVPWAVVHVASLGLLPCRYATEHVLELQVIDPGAPPGQRIRIARRSYVDAAWEWLPLAGVAGRGDPRAAQLEVHRVGLARAIDDALDAILELPGPVPPRGRRSPRRRAATALRRRRPGRHHQGQAGGQRHRRERAHRSGPAHRAEPQADHGRERAPPPRAGEPQRRRGHEPQRREHRRGDRLERIEAPPEREPVRAERGESGRPPGEAAVRQ
jgi:hypothetical protein